MSRKLILLNLALLALAGELVWQARKHYLEIKAHEREVLQRSVKPVPVLPPPAAPAPQPVAAMQYTDVAQRTLFSKDRNPTVIVEVTPPKPEPPMPALPVYYGQINLGGDPVIFLALRGDQKRFHAGEKVGDFEIVSFDRDKITFGWNNKHVEKKLDELKPKANDPGQAQVVIQQPQQSNAPSGGGAQIKTLGGSSSDASKSDSPVGQTISGTELRACSMNDQVPEGKVVDGYQKVVKTTLFGKTCYWEKVK